MSDKPDTEHVTGPVTDSLSEENRRWDQKRRWVGPVMAGSIILNVFLVGFVAARLVTPDQSASDSTVEFQMRSLPAGLSPQARERLEDEIRARQDEMNAAYEELNATQERVNEILTSEKIDGLALERELANLRRLQMDVQGPIHRAFIEASTAMNREMRRELMRERQLERIERLRLPESVDGVNWSFRVEDGKVKLDVDMEGIEGLEDLTALENFEIYLDDEDDDEWWLDDEEDEEDEDKPEPPRNFRR